MALITIKTYDNAIDAYLFKSKLESEGIVCYIFDEHTVSINPLYNVTVGGIKLKINEEDLEKARAVYAELMGSAYTDDAGNAITCPSCGSTDLHSGYKTRKGWKGFVSSLMALLITMMPFYFKTVYKCKACDHEFK